MLPQVFAASVQHWSTPRGTASLAIVNRARVLLPSPTTTH